MIQTKVLEILVKFDIIHRARVSSFGVAAGLGRRTKTQAGGPTLTGLSQSIKSGLLRRFGTI
jgi:hypothetical protein